MATAPEPHQRNRRIVTGRTVEAERDLYHGDDRTLKTKATASEAMKEIEHLLDDIGWKILGELQQQCPDPVRGTGPHRWTLDSGGDRARAQMEEAGIIVGYRAQIDPAKVGLPMLAFVNVKVGGENLARFMDLAATIPKFWSATASPAPNRFC